MAAVCVQGVVLFRPPSLHPGIAQIRKPQPSDITLSVWRYKKAECLLMLISFDGEWQLVEGYAVIYHMTLIQRDARHNNATFVWQVWILNASPIVIACERMWWSFCQRAIWLSFVGVMISISCRLTSWPSVCVCVLLLLWCMSLYMNCSVSCSLLCSSRSVLTCFLGSLSSLGVFVTLCVPP